jgi:PAS domain S-box-containing protein
VSGRWRQEKSWLVNPRGISMNNEVPEINPSLQLLEEAEQTLEAIRHGGVDAFVVQESEGHRVYALEGADLPYSTLVERMQQGAAMLNCDGTVIYCNQALGDLLGMPREALIGRVLRDFLAPTDAGVCETLIRGAQVSPCDGEMSLCYDNGALIPANFSFTALSRDKSATGVLVTDLRQQKEQAEFAARLQNVQEEERKRIARELHDSAGQLLAAIGINLGALSAQSQKLSPEAAKAVADSSILLDQVSSEIRTISYLLHPPLLDAVGLVSALRWYVDGFSERSRIKVDLEIADDVKRFTEETEIAVFRIIQECLTNVHRHSGSANAVISLRQEDHRLVVRVRDEGKGISQEKQKALTAKGSGGVGFVGMRERLRQFGGTLEIQSNETGTVVTATLKMA